jgi:hypothetical protein
VSFQFVGHVDLLLQGTTEILGEQPPVGALQTQQQKGDSAGAAVILGEIIARYPAYADAYLLLGGIYEKEGDKVRAEEVYNKGVAVEGISDVYKLRIKAHLDALKPAN